MMASERRFVNRQAGQVEGLPEGVASLAEGPVDGVEQRLLQRHVAALGNPAGGRGLADDRVEVSLKRAVVEERGRTR